MPLTLVMSLPRVRAVATGTGCLVPGLSCKVGHLCSPTSSPPDCAGIPTVKQRRCDLEMQTSVLLSKKPTCWGPLPGESFQRQQGWPSGRPPPTLCSQSVPGADLSHNWDRD